MTSALVATRLAPGAPSLDADLESVGIQVLGTAERGNLVQEVIRHAPDLVVCYEPHPDDALFASTAMLVATAPRPVVVFTSDPDAEKIERATRSGIHAYVVNGYAVQRLRSIVHVAQARFRHEQTLRDELSEISHRFDERKLVDRAKGILMRARQISEEDAFRLLRSAAMHSKQRVGQVSQQVIDSARYAEAVNRAGQLRMHSQRLVKLYALLCVGVLRAQTEASFADSIAKVGNNLTTLARSLSRPTFGDLLDAVTAPWHALEAALKNAPDPARLAEIDTLAERLLVQAELLTASLEHAGLATTLRVINVSGRQRMLAQRLAKQAMLGVLLVGDTAGAGSTEAPNAQVVAARATEAAFTEALGYLHAIPLSTREIREDLDGAAVAWESLRHAAQRAQTPEGREELARSSEDLLTHFDRLTGHYERSMQMLMG